VDQVCDHFEAAWKAAPPGAYPLLEAYASAVPEPARAPLFRELLELDLAYRRQAGETPLLDDYLARFPEYRDLLPAAFGDRDSAPSQPEKTGELETVVKTLPPGGARAPGRSGSDPDAASRLPAVPGYEVLGLLGRGAMGVVYKARQVGLKRLVALKMLSAGSHASPDLLARFRAESEAISRLQHPHIVQVYQVGVHDDRPYFSQEYVEGGTLAQRLDGTPWPARSAAALVETLARAAHYAHEHGVIHRDLKPANILLQDLTTEAQRHREDRRENQNEYQEEDEKQKNSSSPSSSLCLGVSVVSFLPKVADFGLAKQLDEKGQTQSGAILGTPGYMAPEQARGLSKSVARPWTSTPWG
jgi:serine/threonine protein kinase